MNDNILWALRKIINEVEWMDNETKSNTLRKVAYTKTHFGYPNNYSNIINHLYQNVRKIKVYYTRIL